jgi:heme/copper-type cytochrome/quinol oxidase subunit 1
MTPRAFATILVRVLGVWLSIEALFRFGDLVTWVSSIPRAEDTAGWTNYPPIAGQSDLYLHDTYYVISHPAVSFIPPALKLILGVAFIFAAHRIARLLCSGVDQTGR